MGECKRQIAILCCCFSLFLNKPAYAFWPVFDFGEIIPIVQNVTTTVDSLSAAKEQLAQLEGALKAIGESIDTINQFSQELQKSIGNITSIVNEVQGTMNLVPGVDVDLSSVTDTLNEANNIQSGLANDLANQTNGVLETAEDLNKQVSSGIDSAQQGAHQAQDFLDKNQGGCKEGEECGEKDKAKEEDKEKTEEEKPKKDFWDKVNEKSEQVSGLVDDANKALDAADKTGLIDTSEIRDTMNDINNKQEGLTDLANQGKEGAESLKGEWNKAEDEKLWDQLKDKYTGEESGDWLDKMNNASEDLSGVTDNLNNALDKVDETGLVDTGEVRDTMNDINNNQERLTDLTNKGKEGADHLKGEWDKAEEEGLWDELKDKYTGEGSGNLMDKLNKATEDLGNVAENLDGALDDVDEMDVIDTGGIRDTIEDVDKKQGDAVKGANKAEEGYNKAKDKYNDYKAKKKEKKEKQEQEQENNGNEPVEEEEEEEEIPDVVDEAVKDELQAGFDAVKEESLKVAEQVNDAFDASIRSLNKTAQDSLKVFDRLEEVIAKTKDIAPADKKEFSARLIELKKEQQRVSDRALAVTEAAKDNYNQEYQEKIADGINNYEKVVDGYVHGNISAAEVSAAGEKLKQDIATIDVMPDKSVLAEINRDEKTLRDNFSRLAEDIKKAGTK